MKIRLTFTEPLLGTAPKNKELYEDFIASKAPKDVDTQDEIESVEEMVEKGITGFHVDGDGNPVLFDYMIKGFFKDACSMLRRVPKSKSSKLTAFKKVIDGLLFVSPRKIPINTNGMELEILQRPLRAQTPKGERVSIAVSETAPALSTIEVDLEVLGGISGALLKEWLDYGKLRGIGQWRNASYGRFTYEILEK